MKYVLQRKEDKKYVTPRGSYRAYTPNLDRAKRFDTREEAEKDRCVENEIIVEVQS